MVHSDRPSPFQLALVVLWVFTSIVRGQDRSPSGYNPFVAPASDEGLQAIDRIQVPEGLQLDLVAAEPHLANPVAFCFDEQGRIYVAETFRHYAGVHDIRRIMDWLDDELASRSVDDRYGYMMRRLGDRAQDWMIESERIKRLEDRDGDGRVDNSTVFAENFNSLLDGIGAGLLARKGDVYFTCIPNLWLLRDQNNDGRSDYRQSLHYGFGVRIGFLGHDLHGLKIGPDGKLYFSIGDRGTSVHTEGRTIGHPDRGDIFRCNLDGSELEVFASGLRNPQELAFDKYGNLFAGDNNSDGGDRARWVYVVEGGDSGWRVGYQFLSDRGPFNAERIWYPEFAGQAAYHLPPITNISAGPSGLVYYPGTGLPEKYDDHFFLVDFRGSRNSEIHAFRVEPKGASFAVVDVERFTTGLTPTDADFGFDGGLYVLDWVSGWDKTGKGRIYRFHDSEVDNRSVVRETKRIISEGMAKRSDRQLARLLAHEDMRVRQEAQFALAEKGTDSTRIFTRVALRNGDQLARLHALWGLGQIASQFKGIKPGREGWDAVEPFLQSLSDEDSEVRAHSARLLGDHRVTEAYQPLLPLLHDDSARVRFFAAMSLGKLGHRGAIAPILNMLKENADQDRYLRHAGVMALTWIDDLDSLLAAARNESSSVRMAVLLALRRMQRPEVAQFLNDSDPLLVVEAARAIYDEPVNGAMTQLAALLKSIDRISSFNDEVRDPLLHRVIHANMRVGTADAAQALAGFVARGGDFEEARAEALAALADWSHPSGRDPVLGLWRPIPSARDAEVAAGALNSSVIAEILDDAPHAVRLAAVEAAGTLGIGGADVKLLDIAGSLAERTSLRIAALEALAALKSPFLSEAVRVASTSSVETIRSTAVGLRAQVDPSDALRALASTLEDGSTVEKRAALTTLPTLSGEDSERLIDSWLEKLMEGQVTPELQLDVLEAAKKHSSTTLSEKVAKYESALPQDDPLAPYRVALQGGDAEAGRKVFVEHQAAACFRCHKIDGEGGEVGPELTGIGGKQSREYILESILFPNKVVAEGFENVLITMKSGAAHAGILKNETASELTLASLEDGVVTLKKADVAKRDRGLSAMPEGITGLLSKADLRDIVEFLAESK